MAEQVTLVNRMDTPLEGVWDGKPTKIRVGENVFDKIVARKFREQNPIMGSLDPRTGEMLYKVGIVEDNDPITPLDPEVLKRFEGSIERWDRALLIGARPSEVVPGDNGLYNVSTWKSGVPRDGSNNFSKAE